MVGLELKRTPPGLEEDQVQQFSTRPPALAIDKYVTSVAHDTKDSKRI